MKKLKSFLFAKTNPSSPLFHFGLFVLRVFVGMTMALAHGWNKIPPSEKFLEGVIEMGFPLPIVFAWSAGLAEFMGGILLAIGLFVRPSALFIAITMGVAGFVRHAEDPFQKQELSLVYLAVAIFFVCVGGGKWSIDSKVRTHFWDTPSPKSVSVP
ncbi:MAG: DoxX family protein [Bdellovibrionales bacterium]